jgi:hypothetical protein
MSASITPRFHTRHLDVTLVGEIDIHAAVHVGLLIDAARSYYRYPTVQLDLMHARVRLRAAAHLRECVRVAAESGLCFVLTASDRTRARIDDSSREGASTPVRRVGFAP